MGVMGVMRHWPDDKPLTLYRYGTEWTSVERGYPHQDADTKVEVEPSTTTQGAVDQRDRLLVWLHTADHYDGSVPFEGCPLCDEVRRQLDITGGQ